MADTTSSGPSEGRQITDAPDAGQDPGATTAPAPAPRRAPAPPAPAPAETAAAPSGDEPAAEPEPGDTSGRPPLEQVATEQAQAGIAREIDTQADQAEEE